MRLAELQGHEVLRIGAGIDQLLDPGEDLDDARILEGELAGEQLAVVVEAELAQQRLAEDVGAGIGPVADARPRSASCRRPAPSSPGRGTGPGRTARWPAA